MAEAIRLTGTQLIDLNDVSPAGEEVDRAESEARFDELARELGDLQELCYAAGTEALLVILQGMDTSGKDGTISHVFEYANPQGAYVASFKVPTHEEAAHDFLWRVHERAPAKGMIGIFNRSHYEAVLVERVNNLVPEAVWSRRYQQINDFESLLASSGTIVLKFFLYISKDEQKERLLKREEDPEKSWKLSAGDWLARQKWPAYMAAYQDVLNRCATPDAPWFVIPADRKWYRNLMVAQALVSTLRPYAKRWQDDLKERGEIALAEVLAARERER
jgi:PPK2 family polyphosphate:nucleotide phosphotransferase